MPYLQIWQRPRKNGKTYLCSMKNLKRGHILALLIVLPVYLSAQQQGIFGKTIWETTLSTSFYFANSYNASYYNGENKNENKISFILNNTYQRQDIANHLNVTDTFLLYAFPQKMRYNPALAIGLGATRYLKNDVLLDFSVNFVRLTASDFFTLEIDPGSVLGPGKYENCPIWGIEERYNIDIGMRKLLPLNHYVSWYFGGGFNFNNTKVKESKIRVGTLEYSLVNVYLNQSYVPGAQINEYEIQQGGIGYGGYANIGLRYRITDNFCFETSGNYYFKKVNLTGYPIMKSNFLLGIKLCFAVVNEEEAP